jgi:ribosome modulation factor
MKPNERGKKAYSSGYTAGISGDGKNTFNYTSAAGLAAWWSAGYSDAVDKKPPRFSNNRDHK